LKGDNDERPLNVPQFPPEIWNMIIKYLPLNDLHNLQLTSRRFDGHVKFVIKQLTERTWKRISDLGLDFETELLRCFDENDALAAFALVNGRTTQSDVLPQLNALCCRICKRQNVLISRLIMNRFAQTTTIYRETMLHFVARDGNTETIKELVRIYNIPVNITDDNDRTPLVEAMMIACMTGVSLHLEDWIKACTDAIWLLVDEFHADVNITTNRWGYINGESLLHIAVDRKKHHIAEKLLSKGANPNATNKRGTTPLHYAVNLEDTSMVKLLTRYCVDVNVKNNNEITPLHMAAKLGYTDIAKILVDSGADVNVIDKEGHTPLHFANNIDIVRYLIEQKADVNVRCNRYSTPLLQAIRHGATDIAKLLIEKGADVNVIDIGSKTQEILYCILNQSRPDKRNI